MQRCNNGKQEELELGYSFPRGQALAPLFIKDWKCIAPLFSKEGLGEIWLLSQWLQCLTF